MSDAPLPEDIRGSWYFLNGDVDAEEAFEDDFDVVSLRLDGEFERWQVSADEVQHVDNGDYTFDGNFLILRGSNTNTYRVDVRSEVEWYLEGKKENRRILRTRQAPSDARSLTEDELQSVRVRPIRVAAEIVGGDPSIPFAELVFETSDGGELPIGSIAREQTGDGSLWVGLTTLADNMPDELWESVVEESYLDTACGSPDDAEHVTVEHIGSHERFDFDYA